LGLISACPKTPLPPGGAGGGKDNLLISFAPTPALPQREREKQSFRTGTVINELLSNSLKYGSLKLVQKANAEKDSQRNPT
jgi:hypothetical protein